MGDMLLAGRSILLVEDEPLILLDLESSLRAAGAKVVSASNVERALALASTEALSAGVLDFDLGTADTSPVCRKLVDRGIPFLFHSGRVDSAVAQWPGAPIVLKSSGRTLMTTLIGLLR